MSKLQRQSIDIPGHAHGDLPIPSGSRVGSFVATGGIRGCDPKNGDLPADVAQQVRFMFANLTTVITAGGARVDTILKVTIWTKTSDARALINDEWVRMFPDHQSRPARHILNYDLPGPMLVQCEALAVAE